MIEVSEKTDTLIDDLELGELLKKHKLLDEQETITFQKELKMQTEDTKNNVLVFSEWIDNNIHLINSGELYKIFANSFSKEYKSGLYEGLNEYFNDRDFIPDNVYFGFKALIKDLLDSELKLDFNVKNKTTNLKLIKKKRIFGCLIGEDHVCYFKENGNDYYVS